MTETALEDFKKSIGRKFRLRGFTSGIMARQDIIIKVHDNGMIKGEFFLAHFLDCRFVEEQPPQLTKIHTHENIH